MSQQLDEIEQTAKTILTALQRRVDPAAGKNVNTLRVEGAGSIWHGIAIGTAISGVIAGMVWIASIASGVQVSIRQAEAYRAAVYVVAPSFSEKVEKELERQKERDPQ